MKLTKNQKIYLGVLGLGILAYATSKYWMPKKKTTSTTPTGNVSTQSAPVTTTTTPVASNNLNTREGKMGFIMNGMVEITKSQVNDALKSSKEKPPKSELDKLYKGINELKKMNPSEFIKNIETNQEKPILDSDLDTWVKFSKAINDPIYKTLKDNNTQKEKFLVEKYGLTKEELKKEDEFMMFALFSVMLGGKPATLELK
jgi:hypothetical protein